MICLGNTSVLQYNSYHLLSMVSQARPPTVTFSGPFTCGDDGTKFSRLVPRVWESTESGNTGQLVYTGNETCNMVDRRNAKILSIGEIDKSTILVSLWLCFFEARSLEKLDGSRSSWGGLCTMYSYVIRWCNSQLDRYDQARRELMRSVSISKFSLQKKTHKRSELCAFCWEL